MSKGRHDTAPLTPRDSDRLRLFATIYEMTEELGIGKGTLNLFRSAETLRQLVRKYGRQESVERMFRLILGARDHRD